MTDYCDTHGHANTLARMPTAHMSELYSKLMESMELLHKRTCASDKRKQKSYFKTPQDVTLISSGNLRQQYGDRPCPSSV